MSLFNQLRCALRSPHNANIINNCILLRYYTLNEDIQKKIDSMVKSDKVVIFMKGLPNAPRCGFSNAVTQILRMHNVDYKSFNVLDDAELREAIKEFSNWPTIPQVYIDGNFVGGCDILLQMHRSGELIEVLKKAGIQSSLAETGQDS